MKHVFQLSLANPVVRDHTVHGQHLLPGLGYVDLIYQTLRSRLEPSVCELRDLTIYRPLVVLPDRSVRCELEVTETPSGSFDVVVGGRAADDSAAALTRYAVGRLDPTVATAFTERIDLPALIGAATKAFDLEELYRRCRDRQLVHSGFMKAQGTCYVTDFGAVVDIRLGPEALAEADAVLFHPTLLDAAAVAAVMLTCPEGELEAEGLALPLFARAFRASTPIQRRCILRVRTSSVERRGEVRYVDVDFFNESGCKIAEIEHLGSKRVRDESAITAARDLPGRVELVLRELVARQLRRPLADVLPDTGYYEMGLNSVALLELVHVIERAAGVGLSPTLLFEYTTLAELSRYLADTYGEAVLGVAGPAESGPGASRANDRPLPSDALHPRQARPDRDIAIVALDGRFPQAAHLDEYWHNLREGRDCITEIPETRWDSGRYFDPEKGRPGKTCSKWGGFIDGVDAFDPLFFNISPREAGLIDPQQRLFLITVWNLLEGAGYTRQRLRDKCRGDIGVYVGLMYQAYSLLGSDLANESMTAVSSYGAIANRVSYFFGFNGPSLAVDSMCSSSALALHLACRDLRNGDCEMAIAGGVNLSIHPKKYIGLSQLRMTGTDPDRRSFADGDGFQPAEAVGAVLLKRLDRALADGDRIHAVIKATATNHGGRSSGFAMPSRPAQRQVIERVLRDAAVDPRTVSYVEAAANGAALVDAVEIEALTQVFRASTTERAFCAIGSAKANIGHAEAASGMTQLAKVVLQLQHRELVPSIKSEPANRHVSLDDSPFYLQREVSTWQRPTLTGRTPAHEVPRRALINSFGAGGSNVSVVVEEYVAPERAPGMRPSSDSGRQVVIVSARTDERLHVAVERLAQHLRVQPLNLADLSYTLQCGREAMASRLALAVADHADLMRALESFLRSTGGRQDLEDRTSPIDAFDAAPVTPGDADQEVRRCLASRDLDGLAALWERGVEVPWAALHAGPREIVPLPTYPFEQHSFWITPDGAVDAGASSPMHPLGAVAPSVVQAARSGIVDPPRTDLERTILRTWEEVLGVSGLGIRDSFLDVGGSSLAAARIAARLEEAFGARIPAAAFVGARPTVEAHAVALVSELATLEDVGTLEQHLQAVAEA